MTIRTHNVYDHRDYLVCAHFAAEVCGEPTYLNKRDQTLLERFHAHLDDTVLQDGWCLAGWERVGEVGIPGQCAVTGEESGMVLLRVHVCKTIHGVLPPYGSR